MHKLAKMSGRMNEGRPTPAVWIITIIPYSSVHRCLAACYVTKCVTVTKQSECSTAFDETLTESAADGQVGDATGGAARR